MTEQTRERPILFSGPMVRAILDGRKTQTRRTTGLDYINNNPHGWEVEREKTGPLWRFRADGFDEGIACPYGVAGDRLWVRETWRAGALNDDDPPSAMLAGATPIYYEADGPADPLRGPGRLRPSIHMPRWASRITLEITGIRVERLQDLSQRDAQAEGAREFPDIPVGTPSKYGRPDRWSMESPPNTDHCLGTPRMAFANLWEKINGAGSYGINPWVWVVEFKRLTFVAHHPV